jgi:hypothetical protein
MSTRDRTLAPTRSPCVGNAFARHYQVHGGSTVTPRGSVSGTLLVMCRKSLAAALTKPRLAHASRSRSCERMPSLICVFHPRVRYVSHGWLTPAAPGARRPVATQCACGDAKARTSTRWKKHMQPRAAGVSPPWFGNAIATSTQQRQLQVELLSLARRGSVTQLQRRMFPTAGSRQPLSVLRADAVADMHLPSANALCFPRLAHASRSWCTTTGRCTMRKRGHAKARTSTPRKRACNRERRASARRGSGNAIATAQRRLELLSLARRGSVTQLQRRTFHDWLTPPLLVADGDDVGGRLEE